MLTVQSSVQNSKILLQIDVSFGNKNMLCINCCNLWLHSVWFQLHELVNNTSCSTARSQNWSKPKFTFKANTIINKQPQQNICKSFYLKHKTTGEFKWPKNKRAHKRTVFTNPPIFQQINAYSWLVSLTNLIQCIVFFFCQKTSN